MNGIGTVALTVCCASLICALVSNFVSDASIKRVLNLVLGAFAVCSLVFPVRAAVLGFSDDYSEIYDSSVDSATYDEADYSRRIVAETKNNLELTLEALLNQNGIYPSKTEVVLSVDKENRIIISQVSIYIDKDAARSDFISELTQQNFGIKPNIITE